MANFWKCPVFFCSRLYKLYSIKVTSFTRGSYYKYIIYGKYNTALPKYRLSGANIFAVWNLLWYMLLLHHHVHFFFIQGVGMMKGRINLDYEHSPDPYDRHRALYLYLPTTEMTGDYTCKVSTLQNDVTGTKRMTVYGK